MTKSEHFAELMKNRHIGPPTWDHIPVPGITPKMDCWIQKGEEDLSYRSSTAGDRTYRFVWRILKGEIPEGLSLRHECHIPACFNPTHLQLGTQTDNMNDMTEAGRRPVGEDHWNDYLLFSGVQYIRHQLALTHRTQTAIGKDVGVKQTAVSKIKRGIRWADLEVMPLPPKEILEGIREMNERRK